MGKKLHIISFNVPHPPDYGGIIDVYYKIKSLSDAGVKIILHCFQYGRGESKELENLCYKVHYYPRKKSFLNVFSKLPYIVKTRKSRKLLQNLTDEIAPVLFEGLHSCYYINSPYIAAYPKIVRTHNIEHSYYRYLARSEKNPRNKLFFEQEAVKLQCFEKRLKHVNHILAISQNDDRYFKNRYKHSTLVSAFHPFEKVESKAGTGDYVLFHGNLGVPENQKAIKYLIEKIFSEITISFMIAGKKPPRWLIDKSDVTPHITLIANPDNEVMKSLIREAQIILIPSFQPTGIKLKLINSLFVGRHCITNSPMVENTGLEGLCHIANSAQDMIRLIHNKFEEEFTYEEIEKRKVILGNKFSNQKNAKKILELI